MRSDGAHDLGVVLDHEDRVAQVAQLVQDVDEARGVAAVQADGGLVEHVERAHQPRAQRGGELDALRLAAGERGGQAVERQVFQANLVQELQPLADLAQHLLGNLRLLGRELDAVEEARRFFHRHGADFADVLAGDADVPRLGAQARAIARGAGGVTAISAEEDAHVQLVLLALQVGEEALDAREVAVALDDELLVVERQLLPGHVERDVVRCARSASAR